MPSLIGWIEKSNEKAAIAEARQVYIDGVGGFTQWYGLGKGPYHELNYRRGIEASMLSFLKEDDGMTGTNDNGQGTNKFTVLTSTNGVNWDNILNKSRGVNRAVFFVNKPQYNKVVGMFYITKDGNYAVRIIDTPWGNNNQYTNKKGIFVEKTY